MLATDPPEADESEDFHTEPQRHEERSNYFRQDSQDLQDFMKRRIWLRISQMSTERKGVQNINIKPYFVTGHDGKSPEK
jgi:hypothetical protein